jgi:hypothetical protein
MAKRFIVVVDDFYPNPDLIRQKALSMSFTEPENLTGWRTHAYQPGRIKERIEKLFKVHIKYWEKDRSKIESCNGVFFSAYSSGNQAETVGIHYDTPQSWVMFLIYMTPGAPYEAGTSLWQHKATGLAAMPTARDAERLNTPLEKLFTILERDLHDRRRWREIDRIGNVYNRAVMFPGRLLHSASKHFGSNRLNGRLYQSFHFPVEWKAR